MYVFDFMKVMCEVLWFLKLGGCVVFVVWGVRMLCGWVEIFLIVDFCVEFDVCLLFFWLGMGNILFLEMVEIGFDNI